ncbi:MAG: hypothetical protein Q7J47_06965 [Azoarcus sp.]|nr:hypothetical protein [Azoarcus sp.]
MSRVLPMRLAAPLLLLVCVGSAVADNMSSPYHEGLGGAKVRVHYVHLSMERVPEFKVKDRESLLTAHEICRQGKEALRQVGEDPGPYQPLPPDGIPEKTWIEDTEIYYGAGRSVVVVTKTEHRIDLGESKKHRDRGLTGDCGLRRTTERIIHFMEGRRVCKVNIAAGKTWLGPSCSKSASGAAASGAARALGDVNVVRRAESLSPGDSLSRAPKSVQGLVGLTGESRVIANHRCEVSGTPSLVEKCIATPESAFPLHISHLNRERAGILLQAVMTDRSYTAREVLLDMEVGDQVFAVPEEEGQPQTGVSPLPRLLR